MKSKVLIAAVILYLLLTFCLIADTIITLSPFTIAMPGWSSAAIWLVRTLAMGALCVVTFVWAYRKGVREGMAFERLSLLGLMQHMNVINTEQAEMLKEAFEYKTSLARAAELLERLDQEQNSKEDPQKL